MSVEATEKTTMPEVVTFNGGTYRVSEHPELKAFVGEVVKHIATTEKTKLYGQFKSLQQKLDQLEFDAKNGGNSIDYTKIEEIVGTQLKEQLAANETSISSKVANLISPVVHSIQSQDANNLEQYKLGLLKANEGLCMPELVVGETKEAIDAALVYSKNLFATYAGKPPVMPINTTVATVTNNLGNPNAKLSENSQQNQVANQPVSAVQQTTTPVVNTPPPAAHVIDQAPVVDIKGISQSDWGAKRKALEAEIRQTLGQG